MGARRRRGGWASKARAAVGTRISGLSRWHRSAGRVVDPALALLLGLLTIQTRRPYKLRLPYAWDSFLYIRALGHFDPTRHQPQPPGYLLYVATARLLLLWVGDPNRALVWVSILASGVAVVASGMGHGPRRRLLQATQSVRCNRQAIASSLRTAAQRSWKRHRRSASETCSPTRLAWRKYWRCSSKPVQKRAAETKLPKPRSG